MTRHKLRFRFRKDGDLRLVSHHDLMRCWERMLRRAGLPFRSTEGFNPKPRMVFALSLPLGIVGMEEIVDIEFEEAVDPAEVLNALRLQAPAGLKILSAEHVDFRNKPRPTRVVYRFHLPKDRWQATAERARHLICSAVCLVERLRPHPRCVDVRPYIEDLDFANGTLQMSLRVTPHGTARPEEILELFGLRDLLDHGGVLERLRVELAKTAPSVENTQMTGAAAAWTPGPDHDS